MNEPVNRARWPSKHKPLADLSENLVFFHQWGITPVKQVRLAVGDYLEAIADSAHTNLGRCAIKLLWLANDGTLWVLKLSTK